MNLLNSYELRLFLLSLGVSAERLDETVLYLEKRIREVAKDTVDKYLPRK